MRAEGEEGPLGRWWSAALTGQRAEVVQAHPGLPSLGGRLEVQGHWGLLGQRGCWEHWVKTGTDWRFKSVFIGSIMVYNVRPIKQVCLFPIPIFDSGTTFRNRYRYAVYNLL